ncbi:MAG: hypothetical protein RL134_2517 [Actinomycetota bacterium]|jgi:hypothetical protein
MIETLWPGSWFRMLDVVDGAPCPVFVGVDTLDGALNIYAGGPEGCGFTIEVDGGVVRVMRRYGSIFEEVDRCRVSPTWPAPVEQPRVRVGAADCFEVRAGNGTFYPFGRDLSTALRMGGLAVRGEL